MIKYKSKCIDEATPLLYCEATTHTHTHKSHNIQTKLNKNFVISTLITVRICVAQTSKILRCDRINGCSIYLHFVNEYLTSHEYITYYIF